MDTLTEIGLRLSSTTSGSQVPARSMRSLFTLAGFLVLSLMGGSLARAQCAEPWASSTNAYGTIQIDGSGTYNFGGGDTQTTAQTISAGWKLSQVLPGACEWQTTATSSAFASINDNSVADFAPCYGRSLYIGEGSSPSSGVLWFSLSNMYQFTVDPHTINVEIQNIKDGVNCSSFTTTQALDWGPEGGVATNPITTTGGAVLRGTTTYMADAGDDAVGGQFAWKVTWAFSPLPDDKCKPCKDRRGSEVSIQSQDLGEDIPIAGTAFSLHYESDRAIGRAGADIVAVRDAESTGGWTLSVHHALEPLIGAWCVGGSCTPYAIMPEALFLGDGSSRDSADVQAPFAYGANLYVTSEDGSEVYAFDKATYAHVQTLRPMTGAVAYTFGYDAKGVLVTVTDGDGNVTTIRRDAAEHPTAIVSPYGQVTTLAVDANGYLSEVTDPAGHSIKLTTDATGLLSSFADANGHVHTFQYDAYGRLLKDSDPAGGSLNLTRTDNSTGYSVSEKTALGVTSEYAIKFASTAGSTTQSFTDTWPGGLQATESDTQSAARVTQNIALPDGTSYGATLGADPRWGVQAPLLTSANLAQGNLTLKYAGSRAATLATSGKPFTLVSQTDKETFNGETYTTVYTAASRTYVETSPMGRELTTVLDAKERIASEQVEGLTAVDFSYDARGRLSNVTQGTRTTTLAYNSVGYLSKLTDPKGLATEWSYDADGNVLTETLPDGRVVGFGYDANGNLTSVKPPAHPAHALAYTSVNLLSEYVPPSVAGTGATTISHNADQDLTKITRPDGETIVYDYDAADRLTSLVTPTETIDYTYSATTGNLTSARVVNGETLAYTYDGPLPTGTTWSGVVSGSVSVSYDDNFLVSSQTVGGGAIAFSYDADGLVTKAGGMTLERNAQNGLLIGTTLGLASDSRSYDSFGELTSYTASAKGAILYKLTSVLDADGRLSSKTETIGAQTMLYDYTYDAAGRLTGVKRNGATISSYTFDANSNRLDAVTASGSTAGTYDAQDRMLTYGAARYSYTPNGDLASRTAGSQSTTYQYDVLGNLTGVTLPGGKAISYVVDAEGRRVGKKINGALVEGYLYDGTQLVAQLDAKDAVVSRFVYASGGPSPDYMLRAGQTYRIFCDPLGSPRFVVNTSTGAVAEALSYDEFGNILSDSSPGFQPFGFAGGLYDQDTKLVRFGARDYDAAVGRFTAKDPILFDGGDTNLYGYALGDPIDLADPSGLSIFRVNPQDFTNASRQSSQLRALQEQRERQQEQLAKQLRDILRKKNRQPCKSKRPKPVEIIYLKPRTTPSKFKIWNANDPRIALPP